MLPTKFEVSWPFGSGVKNRFSRWQPWLPSILVRFPIRMILTILIYQSPRCFLSSFKTIGLSFQEKKWKIDFQDGHFPQTILAFFYLQVTPMLPTKFSVNVTFCYRRSKNRFSRWWPWHDTGFQIEIILAFVALQDTRMLPTKFQVNWPFGSGEEAKNRFSR